MGRMYDANQLTQVADAMFPKVLGIKIVEVTQDVLRAELMVTDDLCTTGGTMHGGAIMTMADFLGAACTMNNVPAGAGTTTIESKTNFVSAAPFGQKVVATCEPVHKGKRTQVWRTTITREDGKLVAVVTQTQMVLEPAKTPEQLLPELFGGKTLAEQKTLLAQLERSGAALYRAFAAQETDEARKKALLKAAEKEEENAVTLEEQA
jgi:1,4-dihydroxy-2-naphthoyl-CoA hydrolase